MLKKYFRRSTVGKAKPWSPKPGGHAADGILAGLDPAGTADMNAVRWPGRDAHEVADRVQLRYAVVARDVLGRSAASDGRSREAGR
jgi:hypothetical protein